MFLDSDFLQTFVFCSLRYRTFCLTYLDINKLMNYFFPKIFHQILASFVTFSEKPIFHRKSSFKTFHSTIVLEFYTNFQKDHMTDC